MASRKKYFNLLFLIGLSLHSLPVVGSEFSLGDFEEVSQETAQTTKAFSEVVTDNPAYAIVPTIALLGGTAFLKRKSIQDFCKKKYKVLAEDIYKDMVNAKAQVNNQIDDKVPVVVQGAAQNVFTWALGPVTDTIENYWEYNRLHVYAATIFSFAGWVGSHPIIGGGFGGITLVAGYLGQAYKMLAELKKQAEENFKALQLQAERNKKELLSKIEKASRDIEGVKTKLEKIIKDTITNAKESIESTFKLEHQELKQEMQQHAVAVKNEIKKEVVIVGEGINRKIEQSNQKIDIQLSGLSKELQVLTDQCISLTGEFDKLHKNNVVRDEKSDVLINQLEKASDDLLSAKQSFSSLSDILLNQMKAFTEKTENQLNNFTHDTTQQLAGMEAKVEAQVQDTAGMKNEVSQLLGKVSESHELITVLQNVQIEGNKKIINLNGLVKEISSKNSLQSELVKKIATQQEESMIQFTTNVSSLEASQSKLQKSFDGFFNKFEEMELELKQLKNEQIRLKKESEELKNILSQNQEEMKKGFSILYQEINKSKQYFDESLSKAAQNVRQHQEKTKEEILSEMRTGFSASPRIGICDSFVPTHSLPHAEDSSKKSDFCLPWNSSRPQLLTPPHVFAGVLGVALTQRAKQGITPK